MEIICRIIEQGALQEREYQTQQGTKEKFASMGFVLQSGGETIFAEMVQEQARKQGELPKDYYYKATLQAYARPWTDQQGQQRYENRVTLTKIAVL
jgi:single-stranded DNA-binding protein